MSTQTHHFDDFIIFYYWIYYWIVSFYLQLQNIENAEEW